ncbi:hypothetical protein [Crossiella sp. NPDC003009]
MDSLLCGHVAYPAERGRVRGPGLHTSPEGTRVADDGWVWGPVGSPRVLDVPVWLRGEEPDQRLSFRDEAWDQPVAWVDEDTVAVQRIGQGDWMMIDGVELYDARTAARAGMFAGPGGPMWGFGSGAGRADRAGRGVPAARAQPGDRRVRRAHRRGAAHTGEYSVDPRETMTW